MAFEVLIGGVGDAFSRVHYGTHLLIRKDGFLLAIDCPDYFARAMDEHRFEPSVQLDVGDIDALYLTHLHGDHVNGLEMTLAYRTMVLQKEPLPVYGIAEVLDELWESRLKVSLGRMFDGENFHDVPRERFLDLRPLSLHTSNTLGPFSVDLRTTKHHIPTTAMRISDSDATLAYSCDTAFDPTLIEWLARDSELILHECTFGKAHTQLTQLQDLPPSIRARLRLVHYADQMIGMNTGDISMATQGQVFRMS